MNRRPREGICLVTGASGNLGSALIRVLAAHGQEVRALVHRRPVPDGAAAAGGLVDQVRADLTDPIAVDALLHGVTSLFMLPGLPGAEHLLGRARSLEVQHVVGVSGAPAMAAERENPVASFMRQAESLITGAGIPWTIIRPHALMSNALRWQSQLEQGDVVRAPFADVRTSAVSPDDVARVAAQALLHDPANAHSGKTHRVTGPEALLPADLVHQLGDALGRPLRVAPVDDTEVGRTTFAEGMSPETARALAELIRGSLDEALVTDTVRSVTGQSPVTFTQWAREHADHYRRPHERRVDAEPPSESL